jgi:DNA-binding GntR family transcriptional regulator
MYVGDEARFPQRSRPQPGHGRYVVAFEHGVDGHALAALEEVGEAHRLAVDENDVDLGMRYADRFDRVLYRRCPDEVAGEFALPPVLREEVVQFRIEAHPRFSLLACISVR